MVLQAYFGRANVACLCSHCSHHLWFYDRGRLEETSFAFIWIQYGGFNIAQFLTFIQKHSIARRKCLQCRLTSGFLPSLEFLKKSWKMSSNFPGLEKVWKIKHKSGKMVKSLEFFFKATTSRLCMFYYFLFWSNLIQKRLCSCVVLMTYLITLSLEKEIIVLVKVWKKSWILDPKICTNPVI